MELQKLVGMEEKKTGFKVEKYGFGRVRGEANSLGRNLGEATQETTLERA